MNRLKSRSRISLLVAATALFTISAAAQAPGMPGGNVGYNAALAKLFADIPAFTANVDAALTNAADNTRMSFPMRMQKREDKFRIEVDFVKIRGSGLALQGLAAMQNIGMARMTSLVDPKERAMVILFPDLKALTRVAMSELDLPDAKVKVAKKQSGKETINGQPCVRQLVTLTSADGQKVEVTTWEATALGNFPVRMLFKQSDGSMVMNYSNVELGAPGEEAFKAPSDYKPYDNISTLMQEAMTKALRAPGGK